MIIWIKLALIALAVLASFFSAQDIFHFAKDGPAPEPNPITSNIPQATEDSADWLKKFPMGDIKDMMFGGVGGVIRWITEGINMMMNWLIHFIKPDAKVPPYFGSIIFFLISVLAFWKGLDTLYDWGHTGGKWLLIVAVMIVAIAITMIFLNVF